MQFRLEMFKLQNFKNKGYFDMIIYVNSKVN